VLQHKGKTSIKSHMSDAHSAEQQKLVSCSTDRATTMLLLQVEAETNAASFRVLKIFTFFS